MLPRRQTEDVATQADLKVLPRKQTWRYCHPDNLEDAATQAELVANTAATQVYSKMLPLGQTGSEHSCNTSVLEDADTGADKAIVVGEGAAKDGNGNDEATATSEGEATSTEGSAEE
jgi:hypothetical protein